MTFLLLDALSFAIDAHGSQVRKNKLENPFIVHPINVATILAKEGGITDLEIIAAAFLHDVVVDTPKTLTDIFEAFNQRIANIVAQFSDDPSLSKDKSKRLQIEIAKHMPIDAKHIALADRLESLRDLIQNSHPGWSAEKTRGYLVWVRAQVDVLRGTNEALENALDREFEKSFNMDGETICCTVLGDQQELLEKYYKLLALE